MFKKLKAKIRHHFRGCDFEEGFSYILTDGRLFRVCGICKAQREATDGSDEFTWVFIKSFSDSVCGDIAEDISFQDFRKANKPIVINKTQPIPPREKFFLIRLRKLFIRPRAVMGL